MQTVMGKLGKIDGELRIIAESGDNLIIMSMAEKVVAPNLNSAQGWARKPRGKSTAPKTARAAVAPFCLTDLHSGCHWVDRAPLIE